MDRKTLNLYPRPDQEFKKKDSIDFQCLKSAIYLTKPSGRFIEVQRWVLYIVTGILTGAVCFLWEFCVEKLVGAKWAAAQTTLLNGGLGLGYLVYIGISLAFGAIGSIVTLKVAPLAAGGGTTETMGYFNGVNYPGVFSKRTLLVKLIGLMCALAAGICIGKEGVLAHIGSIIGYWLVYTPIKMTSYFRNNQEKRLIAAAGTAAGVAAAFGSPIGGTMFAYEVASPAIFWSFELTWKLFVTCCTAVFTVSILSGLVKGNLTNITNAGVIKFGNFENNKFYYWDLPSFMVIGIIGGILGSFFCWVNFELSVRRKKYLTTNFKKSLDTLLIVFFTGTLMYFAPFILKDECNPVPKDETGGSTFNDEELQRYLCPEFAEDGKTKLFSPLASLLFNPLGSVFRLLMDPVIILSYGSLFLYFAIWYPWTLLSYGTNIPAGLFVSGILIGCTFGRIIGEFVKFNIASDPTSISTSSYAVVGAAAILSGYARHTFSLAIIMMESTQSIELFVPVTMAIFIAYYVGGIFSRSIYTNSVRFKNIPWLIEHVPKLSEEIMAGRIMKDPKYLKQQCKVSDIADALEFNPSFNGFPVVNSAHKVVGIITRAYLNIILKKKCFANVQVENDSSRKMINQIAQLKVTQFPQKKPTNQELMRGSLNDVDPDESQYLQQTLIEEIIPEVSQEETFIEKQRLSVSHFLDPKDENNTSDPLNFKQEFNEEEEEVADFDDMMRTLPVTWEDFNQGFHDVVQGYDYVKDICEEFSTKSVDLRPYMQHDPIVVKPTDKLQKILDLFRLHALRHLPVCKGEILVGIITRQDIFAFMSI